MALIVCVCNDACIVHGIPQIMVDETVPLKQLLPVMGQQFGIDDVAEYSLQIQRTRGNLFPSTRRVMCWWCLYIVIVCVHDACGCGCCIVQMDDTFG
jgi:hypothetical protein